MPSPAPVVADRDVSDRAQHLALLPDVDLLVSLLVEVEPADGRLFEGADGGQRSRRESGIVREFRQRRERFFSGVKNDDAGLRSRVARYLGAFHLGQAALRRV